MRAGQSKNVSEQVYQQQAGLNINGVSVTIDGQIYILGGHRSGLFSQFQYGGLRKTLFGMR
jgi:hypothetical protein